MSKSVLVTKSTDIDDIAVAAVADFCARTRPTREDALLLSDLVIPLVARLRHDSLRKMAAALALSQAAPKPLLLALCDFPVAVCSPILTRCAELTVPELLAMISQHGDDHARAIARREGLEEPVVTALRDLNSSGVDRALDLRQRVEADLGQPDAAPAAYAAGADPFDAYRELMHGDMEKHARPLLDMDLDELANLAADPNPVFLQTAIADAVGLTLASATALCADPTSKNLVFALRFIGAPPEKAFGIFASLAPELAVQDGVRQQFLGVYQSVSANEAVRKVWSWRSDDLLAIAREALAANRQEPGDGHATDTHWMAQVA